MPQPEAALTAIGQIARNAPDLPRAVRFYRDVLGLPFMFEAPKLAFFNAGESLDGGPVKPHPLSHGLFQFGRANGKAF
jgi:catechol 2,3-dioxygenase-like lactoylglutathione lyase family enzyme